MSAPWEPSFEHRVKGIAFAVNHKRIGGGYAVFSPPTQVPLLLFFFKLVFCVMQVQK